MSRHLPGFHGLGGRSSRLVILQSLWHFLLKSSNTLGVRRVITEDITLVGALTLRHALPEWNCLLRVVTCHGSKDKSHVISLSLVVTGIFQVAEREILSGYGTSHIANAITYSLIQHTTHNGSTYLLVLLLTQLLGTMLSHGMRNFMT